MKIEVTAEDIANGRRAHDNSCPVALAIGRTLHRENAVSVVSTDVQIFNAAPFAEVEQATFPKEVTKFIKRFDGGKKVEPFTFEIEWNLT